MRSLILVIFMILPATAWAVDYSTFCEIEDGQAKGYVAVTSYDSLTINGYVKFMIYDRGGRLLDRERTYEYEYIYHDTVLVSEVSAGDDAARCVFDVSEAVSEPSPPGPDVNYSVFCEIEGNNAKGFVTVHDYKSLTVNGYVKFKIFNESGGLIDRVRSFEYEYIYHATEQVSGTSVRDGARYCTFDISEAISSDYR